MENMSAYVANLAQYTNGYLVGRWIDLPCEPEYLATQINEILGPVDEEYAIHDTNNLPVNVNEYDDIFQLNEQLEILSEYDYDIIEAIYECTGDMEETIRIITNSKFSYVENVHNDTDLAMNCDEYLLPFDYEALKSLNADFYLDWEKIGRNMRYNGWYIASNNIAICTY